jgi:hypothetical protein
LVSSFTFFAKSQQRLFYAKTNTEDKLNTNFQIIGKVGSNILIYKEHRKERFVSVYDNKMQEIGQQVLGFFAKKYFWGYVY